MAVKIQIASLEALERLIGGDTEVELELRQSVAENFAKKHLKTFANSEGMKITEIGVKQLVLDTLTDEVIEKDSWKRDITRHYLKAQIRASFDKIVKEEFDSVAREYIKETINREAYREKANALVETTASYIVREFAPANIEERINSLVDKKLKEKLGIK